MQDMGNGSHRAKVAKLAIIPSSAKSHNFLEGAADLAGFTDLQKRRGSDVGVSFVPLGLLAGRRSFDFVDCQLLPSHVMVTSFSAAFGSHA